MHGPHLAQSSGLAAALTAEQGKHPVDQNLFAFAHHAAALRAWTSRDLPDFGRPEQFAVSSGFGPVAGSHMVRALIPLESA